MRYSCFSLESVICIEVTRIEHRFRMLATTGLSNIEEVLRQKGDHWDETDAERILDFDGRSDEAGLIHISTFPRPAVVASSLEATCRSPLIRENAYDSLRAGELEETERQRIGWIEVSTGKMTKRHRAAVDRRFNSSEWLLYSKKGIHGSLSPSTKLGVCRPLLILNETRKDKGKRVP